MEHVPAGAGSPATGKQKKKVPKKKLAVLIAGLLLLAIIGLISGVLYRSTTAANIDSSKYQALFLTNGQVYFGKLQHLNGSYMKLTDIFYLQATEAAGQSQNPQETAEQGPDVQLVKLGNEVHGPDDAMIVNKDQVLFFENLKTDGTVSKTIQGYKKPQ